MRADCSFCRTIITVDSSGLVEDHGLCFMSNKQFTVRSDARRVDCPKCGEPEIFVDSEGRFITHYHDGDALCEFSGHSHDQLCCLNITALNKAEQDFPARFSR